MTSSTQLKGLLAGLATVTVIGTAFAQGNPPNPAKSAPVGAGQQSSQKTPMGETGVQAQTGGTTMGATTGTTMSSGSTSSSGTGMGASSSTADTTMAANTTPRRRMRADRN